MQMLMGTKYTSLLLLTAVAAAVGGPMVYFHFFDHGNSPSQAAQPVAALSQAANFDGANAMDGSVGDAAGTSLTAGTSTAPALRWPRVQTQDAAAVLDFRITPEWVVAHWPGVSTGLAQLQLEGYRVPLVTGTARRDLAGSLTYYFTADQKLRQITFLGTTGDPRPLIDLLTTRFHLTRRVVADPGLVAYEAPGHDRQPGSSLQLRLSPTPLPGELHRNYDIELSLVNTVE